MAYPAFTVEFAPGVAASAVPTAPDWVDITSRVSSEWGSAWGRDDEFSESGAGEAELFIANDDGEFDPDNTSGTYFGDLVAGMWFRIKGGTTTANTDVFYGHVSDDGFRVEATQFPDLFVSVRLVDDLEQLANTNLQSSVWELVMSGHAPEAWWRLGESSGSVANDSSGNGHHLAYEGGATFDSRSSLIVGETDPAIEFSGDNLAISETEGVATAYPFSVVATIQTTTEATVAGNGSRTIYSQYGVGASYITLAVFADDLPGTPGTVDFKVFNGAAQVATGSLSAVNDGLVHQIVAVAENASTLVVYVDGVDDSDAYLAGSPTIPATTRTAIGGSSSPDAPGSNPFNGTIDDVVVLADALTSVEVAALYAAASDPWAGELTSARVTQILDAVDFHANRNIDTGQSTMRFAELGGGDAASALRDAAKAEAGFVYVDHQDAGDLRFVDRHERWAATASLTSQATFGDGGGSEVPYDAIDLVDDRVFNRVSVQRANGATITVSDSVSEAARRRTYSESGLLYETDAESRYRAERVVAEKKDRHRVPKTVTLRPRASTHPGWDQVFARKVNDRITVKWRPPYGGTQTFTCWIDGIQHQWSSASGLSTTLSLSPVPYDTTGAPYWVWGTSTWETGTSIARWSY